VEEETGGWGWQCAGSLIFASALVGNKADSGAVINEYLNLAEVSQVPSGRGLTVRVGEREFAVFERAGNFYVLDGRCPHRGGPLGEGVTENGHVYCPMHGWQFDLATGACLENAEKAVGCYPVRVLDGKIQIKI
jgi:nitrite reductase (NADH) small subunit